MAQVVSRSAEFEALNTNIVAVSFGTPQWVGAWLEVTQANFPIYLDADKRSYTAYGLTRSKRAAWGVKNLAYYARALIRGEQLQEFRGETDQLGGNFIIDKDGIVRFTHPSQDPTDRPEIDALIQQLQALNAS